MRAAAVTLVVGMMFAAGCASTPAANEGVASSPPVDPARLDDADFVHEYLVRRPTVTVDEAYRAMLILADGKDDAKTAEQRRAVLEQRQITRPAWKLDAEQPIDKGSVAYMVCRILRIEGGVNRVIFGSWGPGDRRYALRELVYRRMMADAPAYRYITGAELAALLREADQYMQKKGMYQAESVELGAEPPPGGRIQTETK